MHMIELGFGKQRFGFGDIRFEMGIEIGNGDEELEIMRGIEIWMMILVTFEIRLSYFVLICRMKQILPKRIISIILLPFVVDSCGLQKLQIDGTSFYAKLMSQQSFKGMSIG